jgi:hypothetical protein
MDMTQLSNLYEDLLSRINHDEQTGVMNSRDAEFNRAYLLNEYTGILAEAQGLANFSEEEELEDEVEEVSPANEVGDFLLQVGEELGYEDYDEFVEDLAEELEVDPDALDALISEEEVSEEDAAYILGRFGLLEDEDQEDDYEDEDEEDYEEEDEENYNAYLDQTEFRINQLEDVVSQAEFSKNLYNALSEREAIARQMVNEEALPPVFYNILFNAPEGIDISAEFSAMCTSKGVTEEAELHAIDTVLSLFSLVPFGELVYFEAYVDDTAEFSSSYDPEELEELEQAERNVKFRLNI